MRVAFVCAPEHADHSVGRPKHTRIMAGAVDGDVFIGAKAQELRGLLKIRYPLEHGIVTDWDDMEKIWSYIYSEELKTLPEEVWISRDTLAGCCSVQGGWTGADCSIRCC